MRHSRNQLRVARKIEAKALVSGAWPAWERTELPHGPPNSGSDGWYRQIRWAWHNGVFAALARPLPTGGLHLAIRTVSQLEPTWAELQRIKNELLGPERCAVQIYPRESRLIDEADMYHLWVYPAGHEFGFGLHTDDAISALNAAARRE